MSKNIFFLVFLIFLFIGCAPKDQGYVTVIEDPVEKTTAHGKNLPIEEKKIQEIKAIAPPVIDQSDGIATFEVEKKDYIAIVYPSSEINRYALEAINTINGYLLQSHSMTPYHIETFDIQRQTKQSITTVLKTITQNEISNVILMITKDHLDTLKDIELPSDIKIVLPLINKDEIIYDKHLQKVNLLFTGISYQQQFSKLVEYARSNKIVEFYDNSTIGATLHNFLASHKVSYSRQIDDNNGWYKKIVSDLQWRLDGSVLILNTPIVKSSMLLSALTAEEINPKYVLSTQLNFTPLIFSLTQKEDIDNVIIASSISNLSQQYKGYSELLGNNISYNWVNYSSMIAVEYLVSNNIDRFAPLKIVDNQVVYPVKLYQVKRGSFELINF